MVGDVTVSRSLLPKNQSAAEFLFEKIEPMQMVGEFLQDADPNERTQPMGEVERAIFVGSRPKSACFLSQYFLDALCFTLFR